MSHTPGPWTALLHEYGEEIFYGGRGCGMWEIQGPEACYLAADLDPNEDGDPVTAKANALLIAAAPDLLAERDRYRKALEEIVKLSDGHGPSRIEIALEALKAPTPASTKGKP